MPKHRQRQETRACLCSLDRAIFAYATMAYSDTSSTRQPRVAVARKVVLLQALLDLRALHDKNAPTNKKTTTKKQQTATQAHIDSPTFCLFWGRHSLEYKASLEFSPHLFHPAPTSRYFSHTRFKTIYNTWYDLLAPVVCYHYVPMYKKRLHTAIK